MSVSIDTDNALISLAELKTYLANNSGDEFLTDVSNDDQLTLLINAASLYANKFTGVQLLSREQTEYPDTYGGRVLWLNNFPVSITPAVDVRIDSEGEFESDSQVDADDLQIDYTLGRVVLREDVFSEGLAVAKVVYTAGYTTPPDDLKFAVMQLCEHLWKSQKDKLSGINSMNMTGASITLAEEDIPKAAKMILETYSRARL